MPFAGIAASPVLHCAALSGQSPWVNHNCSLAPPGQNQSMPFEICGNGHGNNQSLSRQGSSASLTGRALCLFAHGHFAGANMRQVWTSKQRRWRVPRLLGKLNDAGSQCVAVWTERSPRWSRCSISSLWIDLAEKVLSVCAPESLEPFVTFVTFHWLSFESTVWRVHSCTLALLPSFNVGPVRKAPLQPLADNLEVFQLLHAFVISAKRRPPMCLQQKTWAQRCSNNLKDHRLVTKASWPWVTLHLSCSTCWTSQSETYELFETDPVKYARPTDQVARGRVYSCVAFCQELFQGKVSRGSSTVGTFVLKAFGIGRSPVVSIRSSVRFWLPLGKPKRLAGSPSSGKT